MIDDSEKVIGVIQEQDIEYDADGQVTSRTEVYVKIKVAFRKKALKLLKGPKLSCFLSVALHVGSEGTAYPSIDTIMRETGYSRSVVCNALDELEKLGFIETKRRKHDSTLYSIRGYVWYGSESKPTLLGESQSSKSELSQPQSSETKRSETKRLPDEPKDEPLPPKDNPSVKDNEDSPEKPLDAGTDLYWQHCRQTQANHEAGRAYAVPPSAGGGDVLADTAISLLCSGRMPKRESGTYKDMANIFGEVHAAFELVDMPPAEALAAVRTAMETFLQEKPYMAVYKYPSFKANYVHYLCLALGRADGEGEDDNRAARAAANAEAAARLEERRAACPVMPDDDAVGRAIKDELKLQMTKATFDAHVAPCRFWRDDGVLRVAAPDEFTRDWLEDRLATTVRRVLAGIGGGAGEVEFEVAT